MKEYFFICLKIFKSCTVNKVTLSSLPNKKLITVMCFEELGSGQRDCLSKLFGERKILIFEIWPTSHLTFDLDNVYIQKFKGVDFSDVDKHCGEDRLRLV